MAEALQRIPIAINSEINEKNIEILKNKNQKLETELLTLRTNAVFNLVIWEMNLIYDLSINSNIFKGCIINKDWKWKSGKKDIKLSWKNNLEDQILELKSNVDELELNVRYLRKNVFIIFWIISKKLALF